MKLPPRQVLLTTECAKINGVDPHAPVLNRNSNKDASGRFWYKTWQGGTQFPQEAIENLIKQGHASIF